LYNILKTSWTVVYHFFTESLVPLAVATCSHGGSMFRRRMMGTPNFNIRMCGGIPGKSNELKNSVGYLTILS